MLEPGAEVTTHLRRALEDDLPIASERFHSVVRDARSRVLEVSSFDQRDRATQAFQSQFAAVNGTKPPDRTILLIADSVAMTRAETDVTLKATYAHRVHVMLASQSAGRLGVLPDCQRGRTVHGALNVVSGHRAPLAAIVIQIGMVDCAPRAFASGDIDAVRQVYGKTVAEQMILLAKRFRDRLERDRMQSPYVPLPEFRERYVQLLKRCRSICSAVTATTIVTPSHGALKLSGTPLAENIADYNRAISEIAGHCKTAVVDLDTKIWLRADAATCFTADNYHYNARGHRYAAFAIAEAVAGQLGLPTTRSMQTAKTTSRQPR